MSVEVIYGGWDWMPKDMEAHDLRLQNLWRSLAAQNVGTADFLPNSGLSQRKNEIIQLWDIYLRQRPSVVLEVGTAQGGTFAAWCKLGREDATIIAIDRDLNDCYPRPGNPVHPSIYSGSLAMTCDGGGIHHLKKASQKIIGINGWTSEQKTRDKLNEVLDGLGGEKIDFLFHDASHEASMFHEDFKWLWPLVADGGIFASHDICQSDDPKCNKGEEWARIIQSTDFSALYEYKCGPGEQNMGIGVLIK